MEGEDGDCTGGEKEGEEADGDTTMLLVINPNSASSGGRDTGGANKAR
jgi:hypothetical protein